MSRRFTSFVVLANMRTGSNYLESSLNELAGVTCYGEAFNPHFAGHKGQQALLGVGLAARDADPGLLLRRMREATEGLPGFRYFADHDPRVLDLVLADPLCAKIVLTRNPLDSFISLGIARQTGQWLLTDPRHRRSAKMRFDAGEYDAYLEALRDFHGRIRRALQLSGQAAFDIRYDELSRADVLNGLAAFLGVSARLAAPSARLKRQNPASAADKVTNPEEMIAALARRGGTEPEVTDGDEPARGAALPSWVASAGAPLLFQPVRCGPTARVGRWLAGFGGGERAPGLSSDFTRATLRQWQRTRPGHRSFTVLRHPLARAHAAFCTHILPTGPEAFLRIRETLRQRHAVPLPEGPPGPDWDARAHRAAFLGFLHFLRANLAGQTPIRIDGAWASQLAVLQGFAQVQPPDMILREESLADGLAALAAAVGQPAPPLAPPEEDAPVPLAAIHDSELEAAARAAYGRDYTAFGFSDWR